MRMRKGINVSGAGDLTKDILKAGPGGSYLMTRSTVKNFRNRDEIYYDTTYPLKERAQVDERKVNRQAANQKVRQILAGPHEDALPDDILEKINGILREADEGLES